jgi:hypothetical protein
MKQKLQESLTIEAINSQFFEVKKLQYETHLSWIIFSKNGNIQEMPISFQSNPEISITNSGISLFLINNYDGDDIKLFYNSGFSKIISKEEIPKQ